MEDTYIVELLEKYNTGTLTPDEKAILESWYINQAASNKYEISEEDIEHNLKLIGKNLPLKNHPVITLWPRIAAAVAILVVVSFGIYFYLGTSKHETQYANNKAINDIPPGGNKAILTLANGKKISLNDAKHGEVATQSGIRITKAADEQLVYTITATSKSIEDNGGYNTIETPRGGEYQIILPDQSRVWLNAESSLTYPTRFSGTERKVELKGEAYFEVAHNKKVPFRVKTNNQVVEVLGTAFNINSYLDEPSTKTTLVKGSVKVLQAMSSQFQFLAPGEQSVLTKSGRLSKIKNANIEEATAWKNKLFYFDNSNIEIVMRQLSRWYDIEVEYEGKIPQVKLSGEMYRNTNATRVLDIMSYFNIKYRIELLPVSHRKKVIISQ